MSNSQKPGDPGLKLVEESIEMDDAVDPMEGVEIPEPEYHTLLEVWQSVLAPAEEESKKKVKPQWASRIIAQYAEIGFAQMTAYSDLYYGKVLELSAILDMEIAEDDKCFSRTNIEEDREDNADHYKNLLLLWQMAVQQWELDWHCEAPHAALELAAISEVHKMFFGENGLIAHLEQIGFEYTDDDRDLLGAALVEQREGADE